MLFYQKGTNSKQKSSIEQKIKMQLIQKSFSICLSLYKKSVVNLTDLQRFILYLKWSHMGSNHGPPDYESGALTN